MPPSKVCPQCNAVVPIRLKVCRNRLKFALYNADRVNFKSRNYHVVAYNISILAEGLHFSALVEIFSVMAAPLVSRFPHKALEMFMYLASIVRAERNFDGQRWVAYDRCYS